MNEAAGEKRKREALAMSSAVPNLCTGTFLSALSLTSLEVARPVQVSQGSKKKERNFGERLT